jgi:hypothetical protein
MKRTNRDPLKRLRELEAELDSRRAESNELQKEIAAAMRGGHEFRWPPDVHSSKGDAHSS